jgi:hypothetical protein
MNLDPGQKFALWVTWFLIVLVILLAIATFLKEHTSSGQPWLS